MGTDSVTCKSNMTSISTLSEFLLQSGCQYRVYDLGRGIRKLSTQQFLDIENNKQPHPYPRLGFAWVAVLFWNKQLSGQHYIWFLKLPLDEQGMLVSAARNHFLGIVLEALGRQMDNKSPDELPEHPYGFVPGAQQMADFNSAVRHALKLPETDYQKAALAYLQTPAAFNWQDVPLQGLADIVARLNENSIRALFLSCFNQLNEAVQLSLLNSLENHKIDVSLSEFVLQQMATHEQQSAWQIACLRALSQSQADGLVTAKLTALLNQTTETDTNLMITISGRHWYRLTHEGLLDRFMDRLATQAPSLFAPVFADLVRLPELRANMLSLLRRPDKSDALTQAIGRLFSETQA